MIGKATHTAHILSVSDGPTHAITLRMPPDYVFEAGQYLCVQHPSGLAIPLSIGSAPRALPELELYFKPVDGATDAAAMLELLPNKTLDVSSPMGDVTSGRKGEPLLIVAGGSGGAQAHSCAAHRADVGATAPTTIVWCADSEADIFGSERLRALPRTKLVLRVDPRRTPDNLGLCWLQTHGRSFSSVQTIIAGSPAFVYVVTDLLLSLGFVAERLQADAYSYAPRNPPDVHDAPS